MEVLEGRYPSRLGDSGSTEELGRHNLPCNPSSVEKLVGGSPPLASLSVEEPEDCMHHCGSSGGEL